MKKLILLAIVTTFALSECYTTQQAVDDFNLPKVNKLVLKHCKSVSFLSSQVETCLDNQFNALLEGGRLCPTAKEAGKAVQAITTYGRDGAPLSIDFTMFKYEIMKAQASW